MMKSLVSTGKERESVKRTKGAELEGFFAIVIHVCILYISMFSDGMLMVSPKRQYFRAENHLSPKHVVCQKFLNITNAALINRNDC